jgi:hypothetical protein
MMPAEAELALLRRFRQNQVQTCTIPKKKLCVVGDTFNTAVNIGQSETPCLRDSMHSN